MSCVVCGAVAIPDSDPAECPECFVRRVMSHDSVPMLWCVPPVADVSGVYDYALDEVDDG